MSNPKPRYFTDYGVLEGWGFPADLTDAEARVIAKARWDGIMDVFGARMEALRKAPAPGGGHD